MPSSCGAIDSANGNVAGSGRTVFLSDGVAVRHHPQEICANSHPDASAEYSPIGFPSHSHFSCSLFFSFLYSASLFPHWQERTRLLNCELASPPFQRNSVRQYLQSSGVPSRRPLHFGMSRQSVPHVLQRGSYKNTESIKKNAGENRQRKHFKQVSLLLHQAEVHKSIVGRVHRQSVQDPELPIPATMAPSDF